MPKQEFERRYLHMKAVRYTQCEVNGVPIPKGEKYGELHIPKKIKQITEFDGKKFWPIFRSKGYNSVSYVNCLCAFERERT